MEEDKEEQIDTGKQKQSTLLDYFVPMYKRDEEFYESEEEETNIGYSSTNLISSRISARCDVELEEYTS